MWNLGGDFISPPKALSIFIHSRPENRTLQGIEPLQYFAPGNHGQKPVELHMRFLKKSFTLVEVIFAITIMGILAAIVLPRFGKEGFVGSLALRTTTSQVASDIRYTRQLAITNPFNSTAGHYLISFNFTAKEYKIYKDSISSQNQIGETKKISSGLTCSGTNQFDFYSLGNCVFTGTGLLLSLGTNQNRITVETPTGAVVVEKIS